MRAIGCCKPGPVSVPEALIEFDTPEPELGPRDLLVEVKAISVNPVDVKVREKMTTEQSPKILGYDAAGVVKEIGGEVSHFAVGEEVFYAGDITRPGTNAEFHAVDERIVGKKPGSLSFAEAAALPLTSITAWELLFESLGVTEGKDSEGQDNGESLLIINGAGGVGSILTQIANKLTGLTVIATASRPETIEWVTKMGADHVINHRESLVDQTKALGLEPRYVASLTGSEEHFDAVIELIKPRGRVALIDDPQIYDIKPGKQKALSFSWEYMFARPVFETDDMDRQRELLNRVSQLVDAGELTTTLTNNLGRMSVEALTKAHAEQESGRAIGKNVLDGFN